MCARNQIASRELHHFAMAYTSSSTPTSNPRSFMACRTCSGVTVQPCLCPCSALGAVTRMRNNCGRQCLASPYGRFHVSHQPHQVCPCCVLPRHTGTCPVLVAPTFWAGRNRWSRRTECGSCAIDGLLHCVADQRLRAQVHFLFCAPQMATPRGRANGALSRPRRGY